MTSLPCPTTTEVPRSSEEGMRQFLVEFVSGYNPCTNYTDHVPPALMGLSSIVNELGYMFAESREGKTIVDRQPAELPLSIFPNLICFPLPWNIQKKEPVPPWLSGTDGRINLRYMLANCHKWPVVMPPWEARRICSILPEPADAFSMALKRYGEPIHSYKDGINVLLTTWPFRYGPSHVVHGVEKLDNDKHTVLEMLRREMLKARALFEVLVATITLGKRKGLQATLEMKVPQDTNGRQEAYKGKAIQVVKPLGTGNALSITAEVPVAIDAIVGLWHILCAEDQVQVTL